MTTTTFQGQQVFTLEPQGEPKGTLVWFHGGGWRIPLGEDTLDWGQALVEATGCRVILPDYPVAPETIYPELNGWCCAFWRSVWQSTEGPLFLGGDSAGAHLALCSLPAGFPEKLVMVYAVTTLLPTRDVGSWKAYQRDWTLSPKLMDYFYDAYCPDRAARFGASPLEQLERIPPCLMITAGNDILADQQHDFALRFGAQQSVYAGAHHIFLSRPEGAAFRERALKEIAAFLI